MEPQVVIDRMGLDVYEDLLTEHLRGGQRSNVIKVRGGRPTTSLIR